MTVENFEGKDGSFACQNVTKQAFTQSTVILFFQIKMKPHLRVLALSQNLCYARGQSAGAEIVTSEPCRTSSASVHVSVCLPEFLRSPFTYVSLQIFIILLYVFKAGVNVKESERRSGRRGAKCKVMLFFSVGKEDPDSLLHTDTVFMLRLM